MIKEIAIIKRILRKKITYYDHNNLLLLSYFKIYFYMSNFASIGRFDLVIIIIKIISKFLLIVMKINIKIFV